MSQLWRSWVQCSALVETLVFSGCLIGWTSLNLLLTEQGVASGYCQTDPGTGRTWSNSSTAEYLGNYSTGPPFLRISPTRILHSSCKAQEQSLNLGFTLGSAFLGGTFLPLQLIMGYASLRSLRQVGGALLAVAFLMLAYCCTNPHSLSIFLPFALVGLGVGGSCVLFTSLMLPLFLGSTGSIYTPIVLGCFTASATVFTIIKVIFDAGVHFVPLTLGLGALSFIMLLNSFFFWGVGESGDGTEKYSVRVQVNWYNTVREQTKDQDWCQKSLKYKFQQSLRDKERLMSHRKNLDFKKPEGEGPPLHRSLLSPMFILNLLSDSIILTWIHFYIASLDLHLRSVTEYHRTADLFSSLFGALQMLGLITAPVISMILHRPRIGHKEDQSRERWTPRSMRRLTVAYTLRSLVVTAFGISCLIRALWIQVLGFILHVTIRSSVFILSSSLYQCMFPDSHFGALIGLHVFLCSLVTLSQHPLFQLLTGTLAQDTFWIHGTFLCLSLAAISVPIYLYAEARKTKHPLSRPITRQKLSSQSEQTSV
ncbi:large neutral amino acids transporter small subunit 4-like [Pelodytes ibericus]